jgi:hypothetical protein
MKNNYIIDQENRLHFVIKKISNYGQGKYVNTDSDFVMTYFPQKYIINAMQTQSHTAIPVFLRHKLLVPSIVDLCLTY